MSTTFITRTIYYEGKEVALGWGGGGGGELAPPSEGVNPTDGKLDNISSFRDPHAQ